jgi:DNA-binding LytR/AlgR family response regulator
MTTIKCILIDDEPPALGLLKNYAGRVPFLNLIGIFSNAIEALDFLSREKVDLIYMDVQMPDLSGLELAERIPPRTRIVFCTAFEKYAVQGFKLDALDYLVKPFSYNDFLKTAVKAREWFELTAKSSRKHPNPQHLFVKSGYKTIRIDLDKVLYMEGLKDYIKIFIENNSSPILTLMTMKSMISILPSTHFIRTHRSFIVNMTKIDSFEKAHINIGGIEVPISDSYKSEFMSTIDSDNRESE